MIIHLISSMATRSLLAELLASYERDTGIAVRLEAVGGVDAAARVRAGEVCDVVLLASGAIDKLIDEGYLVRPRVDVAVSPIAIGVRAGAARRDISSADTVRRAVLAAARVGYSTGPSGAHVAKLFERWGIAERMTDRVVVAPPGVPVAELLRRGDVDLAFQQLSELTGDGVDVLGSLPSEIQSVTTFSGAVARTSTEPDDARRVIEFLASPAAADAKRRHGMAPASARGPS